MHKTRKISGDGQRICPSNSAETEFYSPETNSFNSSSESTDSGVANWEEFVSNDGSLFYVEYYSQESSKINAAAAAAAAGGKIEYSQTTLRGGKKSSRRIHSVTVEDFNDVLPNSLLLSNVDTSEESAKTLELVITASDRYRFGRRSTAVESILGFQVMPFVDQPQCLMVDGFVHDMPALFQQGKQIPIGRGDWFKSLDHIEVRTSNIDDLLLQFVEPTKVCLKFQGVSLSEKKETHGGIHEETGVYRRIENYSHFTDVFERVVTLPQSSMDFGFLILPPECYQDDEHKSSLYHYPEDPNNFLYKARGSFLTLNAVLSEELQSKPSVSQLTFEGVEYFVFYRKINSFLVLISYPSKMMTLSEGNLRADELLTYIGFLQPTITLESFKNPSFREFMNNFCKSQRVRLFLQKDQSKTKWSLEEAVNETRQLPLPKEAQLRIFDALSEMGAMDYRSWNDEPLHTHREFFIYGSALYYDNLMLASQMHVDVRRYIEVYLRCRGIYDFSKTHSTKEICVWEEITLRDMDSERYFLAICGRGHLLLTVVLKLYCTSPIELSEKLQPSLFYIEEIQETVEHLIQCGIESLALFWQMSNKRPEIQDLLDNEKVLSPTKDCKKNDYCNKHKKTASLTTGNSRDAENLTRSTSYEEETQICSSLAGSSVQSLTPSEDDSSKKRLSAILDESDSESDWENFGEGNNLRYNNDSDQQSRVTENLWKEIKSVIPIKISPGWHNNLLYFICIDTQNNTSFSPMSSPEHIIPFAREMHLAFHQIRKNLQSSKNKRRDCQRQSLSGDLAPIKEISMTIELNRKHSNAIQFVVVGRLFLLPTKEIYICHQANIPINMVEMAFRLSLFTNG